MSQFEIKRNDRLPALTATLKQGVGTTSEAAIDLTGATVKLLLRLRGAVALTVNAAATIVSAAAGTVSYSWAAADTATAGTYDAEWEITFPGPLIQTVPSASYDVIIITADLG